MSGTINDRIAQVIAAQNITRTKFAEALHLSQPYVSGICTGARQPSDRTILDICRVYGVSELWLREGHARPLQMPYRIGQSKSPQRVLRALR